MKIYLEQKPRHYEGDFPCITIHYRPQEKDEAEKLRSLIEFAVAQSEQD